VFARKIEDRADFEKWFEGQGDKDSLADEGTYVAVGPDGTATAPFRVNKKFEGDSVRYSVDFRDSCDYSRGRRNNLPRTMLDNPAGRPSRAASTCQSYNALLVLNTRGRGTKLRAINGELQVPDNYKFFKIKDPPKPKKDDGVLCNPCGGDGDAGSGSAEPRPIVPGDIADIQLLFTEKTARLKLLGDAHEVTITTEKAGRPACPTRRPCST
jgi:hypothetical protein